MSTRLNQVGSHKTTVASDNGYTNVTYHSTVVVKFNNDEVILNTGGWATPTTIRRMNQAINQYNLFNGRVKIVVRGGKPAYIMDNGKPITFDRTIAIDRSLFRG